MSIHTPISIDLNCDLGESTNPAQVAADLALLDLVTSASIACGGHAGDEATMAATVEAALVRGVSIGAHPGYPDRTNFGRVALELKPDDIETFVHEQITALHRIVRGMGVQSGRVAHVKTHGALYHKAMTDESVARAVSSAVGRIDPGLIMVAMPGTVALRVWRAQGFTVAVESFADRAYEPDGSLRSRTNPGALITDPDAAAAQGVTLARAHDAKAGPHTLCIHSDTPHAVMIAAAVRAALEESGVSIAAMRP